MRRRRHARSRVAPEAAASGEPRREHIFPGQSVPAAELAAGVDLRQFASWQCGAEGMYTGTVTFAPGAALPYHKHEVSEAATVLSGTGLFEVEGRCYRLEPYECLHVPRGAAHRVVNASVKNRLLVHCAFAAASPTREFVNTNFVQENRGAGYPKPRDPEHIIRIKEAPVYELADGTRFYDLFAGRFGTVGICGGYGEFRPGSSLPCHVHDYDESISIVKGRAVCEVRGKRYSLSGCDTAFVPRRQPHRFLNESSDLMAMIWVYAGSEPERVIVNARYCKGTWKWKGLQT